jgi:hypothetical protein
MGLITLGFVVAWMRLGDLQRDTAQGLDSFPVTVSVYTLDQKMAAPRNLKCYLSWGPDPSGEVEVIPIAEGPGFGDHPAATTVLMVPYGRKETVTYRHTFSTRYNHGNECPNFILIAAASQFYAHRDTLCHEGYAQNSITFTGGGKVLE